MELNKTIFESKLLSVFQPSQIDVVPDGACAWVLVALEIGSIELLLSNATPDVFSIYSSDIPEDVELIICRIVNVLFNEYCRDMHKMGSYIT